jgi:molybdopterin synthase catalytic subunit
MEKAVATLKEEIAKIVEEDNIVILAVNHRSSESLYNYKTVKLYIIYKPKYPAYEEQLVRDVKVITIYTGAYQEYSKYDIEDIIEELRKHYEVHEVEIY